MQRCGIAADNKSMTPPRLIQPGQLCFVTVRAVNRCYRFAPSPQALEIIWYCFARTLHKYQGRIEAHEFLWMSNHYHLVLTDRGACLPRFMEELNSLMARALNALHGLCGTVVEKGYNLVLVGTEDKVVKHCVYTLANPCSAHLVERSLQWKGVSSAKLEYGVAVTVERPKCGLWGERCRGAGIQDPRGSKQARSAGRSKLPERVPLVLERPPILLELPDHELRKEIRRRLEERQRDLSVQRKKSRIRVMGWRAATRVDVRLAPRLREERFGAVPHFSASGSAARVFAWQRRRNFMAQYYDALKRFVGGDRAAEFPAGTWLMRVRYRASCVPCAAI